MLQLGTIHATELKVHALDQRDDVVGSIGVGRVLNDGLVPLCVIGILARALAAILESELETVVVVLDQAARRNREGPLGLNRLTVVWRAGSSLERSDHVVVAGIGRCAIKLGAVLVGLGVFLRLAAVPGDVTRSHAHLLHILLAVLVHGDLNGAPVVDKLTLLDGRRLGGHAQRIGGQQVLLGLPVLVHAVLALAVVERPHAIRLDTQVVGLDQPLVRVDGLAEDKLAVEVHDLVLVGVAVILRRAVWHNAFDLVRLASAEHTCQGRRIIRRLFDGDPHVITKATTRREARGNVQIRGLVTRLLGDVEALGGAGGDVGLGIVVALVRAAGVAVLPEARNLGRAIKREDARGIHHAGVALRAVTGDRATVDVATGAAGDVEGVDRHGAVLRSRACAVEVGHPGVVEIDRGVGDAHDAGDGILAARVHHRELLGLLDRGVALARLPHAFVVMAGELAVVEGRGQIRGGIIIV